MVFLDCVLIGFYVEIPINRTYNICQKNCIVSIHIKSYIIKDFVLCLPKIRYMPDIVGLSENLIIAIKYGIFQQID